MSAQSFIRTIEFDHVSHQIFDECTPTYIYRLRRTCKAAKQSVDDYISRTYRIRHHLSRFFSDPASFRQLQRETGIVISGSMALQFLDRSVYKDSDLDLYVTAQHAIKAIEWLEEAGYTYDKLKPINQRVAQERGLMFDLELLSDTAAMKTVGFNAEKRDDPSYSGEYRRYPPPTSGEYFRVIDFYSPPYNSEKRKIQLMVSTASPIAQILSFYSSVVMNFITYYGAYSLFPRDTFDKRRGLIFISPSDPREAVAKYRARGWDLQDTITDEEQANPNSSLRTESRWVGDRKSWFLPFEDVSRDSEIDFVPATLNSFSIMHAIVNRPEPMVEIQYAFLRHGLFKGCYTASFCLTRKLNYFFKKLEEEGVRLDPEEFIDHYLLEWKEHMKSCTCSKETSDCYDTSEIDREPDCGSIDIHEFNPFKKIKKTDDDTTQE